MIASKGKRVLLVDCDPQCNLTGMVLGFKGASVKMTRRSCHGFRSNGVRLWLSLIACNLGNLWRRLVLPKRIDNWSLTSLQQRLVKTGGRLIKHARYYWLMLAESHLTRRLFGTMIWRIGALAVATG
jgi:hypothetical protein